MPLLLKPNKKFASVKCNTLTPFEPYIMNEVAAARSMLVLQREVNKHQMQTEPTLMPDVMLFYTFMCLSFGRCALGNRNFISDSVEVRRTQFSLAGCEIATSHT